MTLIYKRARPLGKPVSHAFVIGCGRFEGDSSLNRVAPVAGARRMIEFLITQKDHLLAPLSTIYCLLSDPDVASGLDQLNLLVQDVDLITNEVAAATSSNAQADGDAWKVCKPGDHLIFYFSSHGVAEADATALGIFEDAQTDPLNKWGPSLNVSTLAQGLPMTGAAASWVFFDGCQEILASILADMGHDHGIKLIVPNVRALTNKARALALAGSQLGGKAWAPTNGDPPYFTQALLKGMAGACVEPVSGQGWAVTGKQLMFSLEAVANAALNYTGLKTAPLNVFNHHISLLTVKQPKVPVVVRTRVETHLKLADHVEATDAAGAVYVAPKGQLAWCFEVDADFTRQFTASARFPAGYEFTYQDRQFYAMPPAQIVTLE